jgi:ADP-ribose pyrophosphatase YjhB (NUDIX family)
MGMKNAVQYQPSIESNVLVPTRNIVRALIVHKGRVLLLRKYSRKGGQRYSMPGGGQDSGETLQQSLLRECREEIAAKVDILGLAHVANAFKPKVGKSRVYRQQVEFVFYCRVPKNYKPRQGKKPDKNQVGVEWVSLQQLNKIDLRPQGMAVLVRRAAMSRGPVFAGTP